MQQSDSEHNENKRRVSAQSCVSSPCDRSPDSRANRFTGCERSTLRFEDPLPQLPGREVAAHNAGYTEARTHASNAYTRVWVGKDIARQNIEVNAQAADKHQTGAGKGNARWTRCLSRSAKTHSQNPFQALNKFFRLSLTKTQEARLS